MSTDKIDPSSKTTNKGDVELSEEELKRVSGGYLEVKLTNVLISGQSQSGGGSTDKASS
jgi:bacteriocin-like protein